jgi:hypothetical protein
LIYSAVQPTIQYHWNIYDEAIRIVRRQIICSVCSY